MLTCGHVLTFFCKTNIISGHCSFRLPLRSYSFISKATGITIAYVLAYETVHHRTEESLWDSEDICVESVCSSIYLSLHKRLMFFSLARENTVCHVIAGGSTPVCFVCL